jgi:hypothetical protein
VTPGSSVLLEYPVVTPGVRPTRRTIHSVEGEVLQPAAFLAIGRYDGDARVYLFDCDESWRVMTDTCHGSIDDARAQAEFEYEGLLTLWRAAV